MMAVRRQLQHLGRCAAGALHPCFRRYGGRCSRVKAASVCSCKSAGLCTGGWCAAGQQQRFLKHRGTFHRRIGFQPRWWPGDQGGIERVGGDLLHQLSGGSGGQVQHHVGPPGMQLRQRLEQARSGLCFPWRPGAGAHPAAAGARPGGPLRPGPAGGRRSRAGFARRCEHHAPPLAQEQRRAQLLFQLLNPRGHVGLHAAQLLCRAGHAASAATALKISSAVKSIQTFFERWFSKIYLFENNKRDIPHTLCLRGAFSCRTLPASGPTRPV